MEKFLIGNFKLGNVIRWIGVFLSINQRDANQSKVAKSCPTFDLFFRNVKKFLILIICQLRQN